MQYKVKKQELAGLRLSGEFSKNSILNLFDEPKVPYTFQQPNINDVLKNPDYVSQLTLVNNYTFFDMKLSFKDNQQVSVITNDDEFLVESPIAITEILTGVKMYTGNSILITSSLDTTLYKNDAYLFATIIDFIRSKRNLLNNEPCTFTEEDIDSFIKSDFDETLLLASYLKTDILGDFNTLLKEKLIVKHNEGYTLLGEALSFSNTFTTIDNYIEVGAVTNVTAGFSAIQSGLYNVLYIEDKGDKISLQTISPGILIEIIEEMIMRNEKLLNIKSPTTEQLNQTSFFCTTCGTKMKPQAKFCGKCGSKV